jgi:Protein of unknown function (DUF4238)
VSDPRKHHYVPRFYLANFSSLEGKKHRLWVYEKGREPRKSTPTLEGCRKDFYAFVENGQRNTEVEAWLSKLEAAVAPLIADLAQGKRGPSPNERIRLAVFMGTLFTRTPFGRQMDESLFAPAVTKRIKSLANDPEAFYKLYAEFNAEPSSRELAEQARQEVLSGKSDELEEDEPFRLASIIHVGIQYGEVLSEMDWQFIHSPEDQLFITSDNPVICEMGDPNDPRRVHLRSGPNHPNAAAWLPLTSRVCLLMHRGLVPGVATAPAKAVREINKRTMMCADKRIYASELSESLRESFEKHGCQLPIEKLDLRYEGQPL